MGGNGEREKELAKLVESTCKVLFPKILGIEQNFVYGGSERQWRQQKRICSEDYFDKYFILGTPIHEISDEQMRLFTAMAGDTEGFYKGLVEFFDRKMGRRLLEKMEDYITAIDERSIERVIIAIFNAEDSIVTEKRVMMTMDASTLAARIVHLLLERIKDSVRRKQLLLNAIAECHKVYLPVHFVSLLTSSDEKDDERRKKEMLGFSASDLSEIQKECLSKIRSFVKEQKLSKAPRLEEILYGWRQWENPQVVKEYVDGLLSTDEGLWEFLIGFTREVLSTSGDYRVIRPKSVGEFADFDNIDGRIKDISLKEASGFTEKQKEVVDALKNGRRKDLP